MAEMAPTSLPLRTLSVLRTCHGAEVMGERRVSAKLFGKQGERMFSTLPASQAREALTKCAGGGLVCCDTV